MLCSVLLADNASLTNKLYNMNKVDNESNRRNRKYVSTYSFFILIYKP